jgi:putative MATE family efflux protein
MPTIQRIIALGLPLGLQMIVVSSSFIFILSLANKFGPTITAVFGIGSRVDQFAFLAMFAVTAAISAMTAQNFGAGKLERIISVSKWGVLISAGLSLIFFTAVTVFPDSITGLFTKDLEVIRLTRNYFHYVSFSYLALAVLFTYQGVLRGVGDTITSFIIVSCSMVVLRVPICYCLSHYTPMQESGLWLGITISSTFGALTFYLYYAAGRWKRHPNLNRVPVDTIPVVPEETM